MFGSRFTRHTLAFVAVGSLAACAPPRIAALPGAAAPSRRLPSPPPPTGHRRVVFDWELKDQDLTAKGEGVARIAYPDSIRLDFFLGGAYGGGAAILIGDSLAVPGNDMARRLIPPRTLLWAALGQLVLPAERDTVVRVDGPTLRADVGSPVHWRVTFQDDSLTRLERIDGGRLREWVERGPDKRVQYRHESSGRMLTLVLQRLDTVNAFDSSIWRF